MANRGSDTVSVIEVATRSVIATVPVGNAPESIDFSPDGKRARVMNGLASSVVVLE